LEERLRDTEKTATDFMLSTSSDTTTHRHKEDDIHMTGSVSCQTEETTYPVGPVKEEVNVEIPTIPTLPLKTNIEKGSNEDKNEVVATAGDGVENWCMCHGLKMTYSSFSDRIRIRCNLCKCFLDKKNWEKHSVKCRRNMKHVTCTC